MRQGVHLSREDSGRKHLNSEEVRRGFLRPSLEETLAFERSRSVGEESWRRLWGPARYGFLCLSFVCLLFFFCFTHTFVSVFFCYRVKEFLPGLFLL